MTAVPLTRARLRRTIALSPEGRRAPLLPTFYDAIGEPPAGGPDKLAAYLCDPLARAIAAPPSDTALTAWLERPLFVPVAACHVAPIADDVAALLCAEMFTSAGRLSGALDRWRFSPRADVAVAAGVSALPPDAAGSELERLARTAGPDEARLHLALLQAGRALGWTPQAWERPIAQEVVDRLLALLDPASPGPLLLEVTRALAPLAIAGEPLGAHVREAAARTLRATVARIAAPAPAASFADEVRAIARERKIPDQAYWASLPARQVAAACARLLGCGAPPEPARFAPYQEAILAVEPELVFGPFIDGLIAAAATGPLSALVATLAGGGDGERALALDIASRFPVDGSAPALRAALDESDPLTRMSAVDAVAWLDGDDATEALAARLADPEPEVAARAALALMDRGDAAIARVRAAGAGDLANTRVAAIAVTGGDLSTRAVSTLVNSANAALATPDGGDVVPDSIIMDVLARACFGSVAGLVTCANLLAAAPVALPVVALAAAHDPDDLDAGISVPPDGGRELATELFALVERGGEIEAQALVVLARLFCGDRGMVAPLARGLERTDGWADHLITAIACLRVRDPAFARVLAPYLADRDHIAARVVACAAAGRALPADDAGWAHVEELLGLGALAGAAAWAALRDRVRFATP